MNKISQYYVIVVSIVVMILTGLIARVVFEYIISDETSLEKFKNV